MPMHSKASSPTKEAPAATTAFAILNHNKTAAIALQSQQNAAV